jgi:hypothetical protein
LRASHKGSGLRETAALGNQHEGAKKIGLKGLQRVHGHQFI